MVKRNPHVAKLNAGYLFPEITRRKNEFLTLNPTANLISLGIGDTTEPLPQFIANAMAKAALKLGTAEGYSGYGPEEGQQELRRQISKVIYNSHFETNEIFISDGTNSDIARLQTLFGSQVKLAVQDPSYPVYIDTGVILGQSEEFHHISRQYQGVSYLACLPENQFFPSLDHLSSCDLIYFCSPNNPTGAVATRAQLKKLVDFARKNRSIIIFDTAYAAYIQEADFPRSIYEIEGAKEVAIELGSFSKMAGFTGVRLAWSVVPKELKFDSGQSINQDWTRVHTTFFNGASNISQAGGLAALESEGQDGVQSLIRYYLDNAAILRRVFETWDYEVYGGVNAPFLWVRFSGLSSWEAFEMLLNQAHLITAPGSGFGPAGEGFLRFSAFGNRSRIEEAAKRLGNILSTAPIKN